MKTGIRILLVDDHTLVRDGLEAILELEKDVEHIDHAASAKEALAAVRACPPEIVLLDRRMPDCDGLDLLAELRVLAPRSRVIMMTAAASRSDIETARQLGAAGHLPKTVRRAELVIAIRTVLAGGTSFDMVSPSLSPGSGPVLSPRELQVLENLRRGLSNHDISLVMDISEYTVKAHLKVIFAKLGCSGRAEAVTRGFELGLLSL